MNEDTLVIARYDAEKNVWVPLKSKVDSDNKQIIAYTDKISVYAIMGTTNAAKAFEKMKYYPNPIQPSKGLNYAKMSFANMPAGTRIKIYTMLGQVVRDLEADATGTAVWDGKNNAGAKAASGVYIVYMEDGNGNKKRIKIAVER
jgi:flagellar hook assembly protein FlgD